MTEEINGIKASNQAEQKNKATPTMVIYEKSDILAAILSLLIPGAGQLYKGKVLAAIIWFIVVPIGYFPFFIPGILLHIVCIIFAAVSKPK